MTTTSSDTEQVPVAAPLVGRPDDVTGPVAAGQSFGAVEILQGGRVVGRIPMVAASSLPAADFGQKAKAWFTSPLPANSLSRRLFNSFTSEAALSLARCTRVRSTLRPMTSRISLASKGLLI